MEEWLFTCLRISFFGSVMILAVLLVRPLLQKAPRNITCLLWLLVALRLLLPFELQSSVSLQPLTMSEPVSITDLAPQRSPERPENTVTELQQAPQQSVPDVQPESPPSAIDAQPELQQSFVHEQPQPSWAVEPATVFAAIWIAGCVGLLVYAAVSLAVLRHRVRDAIRCSDGVWESDRIADAFLLGYWKPRIYLPVGLSQRDRALIVCHERAHQSRGDQWWKLLGLICLSIHWFNPLVWLAFVLMCRDIEAACDEKVIGNLDLAQRKDYSMALLNSGKRMSGLLSCPVAFGEVNLKQRIKSVLSYRKPRLWVTLGAVTVAAVIALCFMTNPVNGKECIHEFDSVITAEASCLNEGIQTQTCRLCGHSKEEPVPTKGHRFDDGVVTQEASCITEGIRTYTCALCAEIKTQIIPMAEHTFETAAENQTLTKEATCLEEGEITAACTVCGARGLVGKTPKSDTHTYVNEVLRKPTCMDPGEGREICTLCGHSVSCVYDLTDHTYGDAVVTKKATCTTKGEQIYTCTVCEYTKAEAIAKKDHVWNEADCNTAATCTVCGAKGQIRGHNYVYSRDWSSVGRVLEEKIGTCTVCGDTKRLYGSYDLEEVKSIGTNYAKKLGFITDPCPGHGSYSKITRDPYYSVVRLNGGQEMLEDMLISMIDEMDSRCEDNSKYYAEVVVEYPNPYGIGDGAYFRLIVYYHLCVQGE